MSQQLLRKVPKQTSLNFTERRGIIRGMPCIIVRGCRSSYFFALLKTTEANLIRLYEKVNNDEIMPRAREASYFHKLRTENARIRMPFKFQS